MCSQSRLRGELLRLRSAPPPPHTLREKLRQRAETWQRRTTVLQVEWMSTAYEAGDTRGWDQPAPMRVKGL